MTRREFTARLSARIVWMGLILESVYFFYLSSRIAAAVRGTPGWQPDGAEPSSVVMTAVLGCIVLGAGIVYMLQLFRIRGWFHLLAPVFLVFGLFQVIGSIGLTDYIYGTWKTLPVALNAAAGFGFMLLGVFAIIARMFMPRWQANAEGALPPNAPADRPEP
jgi:hypothetical protein